MKSVSPSAQAWLHAHGLPDTADDAAALRCLEAARPADSAWGEESRAWLSTLTACLPALNEQLYHQYRPMADLFRLSAFSFLPAASPDDPLRAEVLRVGACLGLLSPDDFARVPHILPAE